MIKSITIENVGNIKKAEYNLIDKLNIFEADNGIGKTNTLNALSYLLSKRIFSDNGKSENEFTSLIPVNDDRAVSFVEIENEIGQKFGFKFYNLFQKTRGSNEEVFKGRTTEYYYNGVKCKNIAEFDLAMNNAFNLDLLKKIKVNDSKFNAMALITDVFYAFTKMDYKQLRELVIYFTGDITFDDLASKNLDFELLRDDYLKYDSRLDIARKNYKSVILELKKQVDVKDEILKGLNIEFDKDKLKELEDRKKEIETLKRNDLKTGDSILLDMQKEVIEAEKKYLNSRASDYENNKNYKLDNALDENNNLVNKVHTCEITIKDYEINLTRIKEFGKNNKNNYQMLEKQHEQLQLKLAELIANPNKCPNCGYVLNEEENHSKIEEVKEQIRIITNKMEQLIDETKSLAIDKINLETLLENAKTDLSDLKAKLEENTVTLNKIKAEPFNPISKATEALKTDYENLRQKLIDVELDYQNKKDELDLKYQDELIAINTEIEPLLQSKYNKQLYEKTDKEKLELIKQLNDAETRYELCDKYIKTRIKCINDKTFETFGIEFEMLKEQVNGGLEEVCYPVLTGKTYNQLNRGLKEILGVKFIAKIKDLTKVKGLPILIDNAESLGSNTLKEIVNLGGQIIATRVVSGKNQIELIKEVI